MEDVHLSLTKNTFAAIRNYLEEVVVPDTLEDTLSDMENTPALNRETFKFYHEYSKTHEAFAKDLVLVWTYLKNHQNKAGIISAINDNIFTDRTYSSYNGVSSRLLFSFCFMDDKITDIITDSMSMRNE